MPGIEFIRFA